MIEQSWSLNKINNSEITLLSANVCSTMHYRRINSSSMNYVTEHQIDNMLALGQIVACTE